MRNWYDGSCDCNNPDPVIGVIVGGKKFPFGTVKQSDYNADQQEVNDRLTALDDRINVYKLLTDTEINAVNQKITADEKKIEAVTANTVKNSDEISGLKGSVAAINTGVAALTAEVKKAESDIISVTKQVSEVSGRVASYDSTISELKIAISNINATIKSITDVTENLDTRVTALEKGPEPEPVPPVQKFYAYWGASSAATPNMSVVSALPYKTYTDTVLRTITVPCNNEYVYYCIPKSEGNVQFEVSGFTGGFEAPVEVGVIDSEGDSVIYNVYRSSQLLEGTAPIKVKR